ncbi:MAG: DUF5684 domain-containing protein [Bacteroidota bacterium]
MENGAAFGVFMFFYVSFCLAIFGLLIFSKWRIFEKAGEEGWKAIIPIYNYWTLYEIAGKPGWWALFIVGAFVPFFNILLGPTALVLYVIAVVSLANKFKAGDGMKVGLIFLPMVFFPILALGDYQYHPDDNETLQDKIDNIGKEEGGGVEEINIKDW